MAHVSIFKALDSGVYTLWIVYVIVYIVHIVYRYIVYITIVAPTVQDT